ncbi:MAG: alcohol dehydrogenase catalytic domain-containing protein [Pseudomonadota bacterium]|nr:alcohol dehydrogenase catalytic domain-containing protein [Pseudomonadota bacterium]
MKALRYSTTGIKLVDAPRPIIANDDDVIVEIAATGICGTDVQILLGQLDANEGVILGHESSGVLIAVGSAVDNLEVDDRVVINPTYYCTECRQCRRGYVNYCEGKLRGEAGVSTDGMFAEFYRSSSRFVHRIPDAISFASATLTEPLACVLTGLARTRIQIGDRVLVLGAGPIGLLTAVACEARGATVEVVESDPQRSELAARILDASVVTSVDSTTAPMVELAVDTVGRCVDSLLPRIDRGGQILLLGIARGYRASIPLAQLVERGIDLVASCDTAGSYPAALDLLASEPRSRRIVTAEFRLADFEAALISLGVDYRARTRGNSSQAKVVLVP